MAVLRGSCGAAIEIPALPASNYLEGENAMESVLFVLSKMNQYPVNNVLVLNAGDDSDRTTTVTANCKVGIDHALEPLRPVHNDVPFSG